MLPKQPAAAIGLKPGDQIVADQRRSGGGRERHPDHDLRSQGQAADRRGAARTRRLVTLGPVRPQQIDGAFRLGFVLRGEKLGIGESVVAVDSS